MAPAGVKPRLDNTTPIRQFKGRYGLRQDFDEVANIVLSSDDDGSQRCYIACLLATTFVLLITCVVLYCPASEAVVFSASRLDGHLCL